MSAVPLGAVHPTLWVVACRACGETGAAWPDHGSAQIDRDTMQRDGDCCEARQWIVLRYVRSASERSVAQIVDAARQLVYGDGDDTIANYKALARAVRDAGAPKTSPSRETGESNG